MEVGGIDEQAERARFIESHSRLGREGKNGSQKEKGDRMNYGLLRGRKEPRWRRSSWVEKELGCDLANWGFRWEQIRSPRLRGSGRLLRTFQRPCAIWTGEFGRNREDKGRFLPSFRVFLDINSLLEWKA